MADTDDIDKLIDDVLEHDKLATQRPWRAGAVERDKIFVPCTCCMGPERVLATMNPHFEYVTDAESIAVFRNTAPTLATELREARARERAMQAALRAAGHSEYDRSVINWVRAEYDRQLEESRRG